MRPLAPALLLLLFACDAGGNATPSEDVVVTPDVLFSDPVGVVSVLDGDTLLVARGGSSFKVRLRGVDTPELYLESDLPPEAYAEEARSLTLSLVGLEIGLEYDEECTPSPAPVCFDPFDRVLAYVRLASGEDLGERLIREGLARMMIFNDQPFDRLDAYVDALGAAQEEGLAIWSN